jgi:hypothetical protein
MRRGLMSIAGLALALAAGPLPALGAEGDILPTVTDLGGSLEIGGLHERFMQRAGGIEHTTVDTFLTERVTLMATGFVYHPRLLVFYGKIGGGLAHEDVQSNYGTGGPGGMKTEALEEYDLRTIVLPEHPYNLELYTQRDNPYQRGRVAYGSAYLSTASGAVFQLKLRPWVANLSYRSSSTSSGTATRDIDTLSSNLVYYRDWGSLAGSYSHADTTASFNGSDSLSLADDYSVDNQLRFFGSKLTLSSTLGWNNFDQKNAVETMADKRFSWTERLSLALPLNFEIFASANRYDDAVERRQELTGEATAQTSRSDTLGFTVRQKLYQSLTTSYDFTLQSLDSTSGGSTGTTHSLSSSYLKRIPGGTLSAAVTAARSSIDRTGSPAVINETHGARLFDEFTLAQADADPGSIAVAVRSASSGNLVVLTQDLHYQISATGTAISVRVLTLPASVLSADPFFTYVFSVSYSLTAALETIDTTSYGGSLRLEIFDHLVSPYASYSFTRESGSVSAPGGGPLDTVGTTFGLALQRLPFTLTLEYYHLESELNPLARIKAEFDFRLEIGANSQVFGQARYATTDYQEGTYLQQAHTDESVSTSLRVQERFPQINLTLLVGGTYDNSSGEYRRESYSLDGELTWLIRQLEVTASVSLATSSLEMPTRQEKSEHQLYYLKMTRKLF